MYISKIKIQNYRCFKDTTVEFSDGLNVIIGENNSGKTTILSALGLIFDRHRSRSLTEDDFFRGINDFSEPPEIIITVTLKENKNEYEEDKAVVATWVTKLEHPWEATLTYKYLLPERNIDEYQKAINASTSLEDKWKILSRFIPKYKSYLYGGEPSLKNQAETEWLEKFDFKLLDALRDVENKMFTGKNPLLKRMLKFFIDYSIKTATGISPDKKEKEIKKRNEDFNESSEKISEDIKKRIDLNEILRLARKTGAEDGGTISFSGYLSQADVLSILKLMVKQSGFDMPIPVINNGLGYNNLIYISLILSELVLNKTEEYGENATVFPILLIEEPEAHLHPALQYRVLKFLNREIEKKEFSRQIFLTTHSSHITAATPLDSIICMFINDNQKINVSYPGRVFNEANDNDIKSKKYVERYLDATKSAMLFAKSVLLVEGIAEQLIIPVMAEYVLCCDGDDENKSLEDFYISLVAVGGSTFKHFIKLFDFFEGNEYKKNAIKKKVVCIVDADPQRIEKDAIKPRWKVCYPYEIGIDEEKYNYKTSSIISNLNDSFECEQIKLFYDNEKGKTLEYDIAFHNHKSSLFNCTSDGIDIETNPCWNSDDIEKAKIATKYFEAVNGKGENAYDLANCLKQNFQSSWKDGQGNIQKNPFVVPPHIEQAIKWICGVEGNND